MRWLRISPLLGLLVLAGCDEAFQSGSARAIKNADQKYREGDYRAAAQFYERGLDGTAQTAELHYKLALLYDDKLSDSVGALHHFQRYLDLEPKGARAKEARDFARQTERKLVTKLARGALMTQEDSARLKNENLSLRKELTELRARPRVVAAPSGKETEQIQKPLRPGVRTYVVERGDTLASISRRFYKTSGKWKDIQNANFNKLEGTAKLKPGMTLTIP